LLLLDEPLSALDARVRVRLRHEIRALQRRLGVTTIMVTHDQEEALTMADRIVVMNQGIIEQIGTPVEIYRHPATPFVADFVGTMNFLDATLVAPGRVRLGAVEVACGASDGLVPGAAVQLCFRPEDVSVRQVERSTPNVVDVTIEGLEFLGSFCRGTLKPLDGGPNEFVADFSINLVRDFDLAVGRNLSVALPADRLRIYPKS
jgi:iron(III) transport system ATP-binding protein